MSGLGEIIGKWEGRGGLACSLVGFAGLVISGERGGKKEWQTPASVT